MDPPFEHFIQSPIGLVPKDNGKDHRLIFHLSYPQKKEEQLSVNGNMPPELCRVKYPNFTEAVQLYIREGQSCKIGCSNIKAAFRNLGILRCHWYLLVLKARNPVDLKFYYFFDKCLPFGASISCSHFQRVSNGIAHIVSTRTGKKLVNYLHDYYFAALVKLVCNGQIREFLQVCAVINFPIFLEKTFWAMTRMVFLGMLIDMVIQCMCILMDKIEKAQILIRGVLDRSSKKLTVKELQHICGVLNFFCRCVVPGRAFTRCLFHYTSNMYLQPHHHIRINAEMRKDLMTWMSFLEHPSIYCRPFVDFHDYLVVDELNFYTDASGKIGMGEICNLSWMYQIWNHCFLRSCNPSIEYLELYALVAEVLQWVSRFQNRRIIIFCDNKSVQDMVNQSSSSCRNCMVLIRLLVLAELKHNVRIFIKYVKSSENYWADMLSRAKLAQFKREGLEEGIFELDRTPVPSEIWPVEKIWMS